jgi:hypothetical protein
MTNQPDDDFSDLPSLPPLEPGAISPLPGDKPPLTRAQKLRDFLIGFGGWWLINGLATGCYYGVYALLLGQYAGVDSRALTLFSQGLNAVSCLWLVINVGVLIFLAFKRPWIAVGIAAAYALLFVIGLCLGVFLLVFCFWVLGQYGGG